MKLNLNLLLIITASFTAAQSQTLQNNTDSLSYALGQDIGRSLKGTDVQLNTQVLVSSLSAALNGQTSIFGQEEGMEIIQQAMKKAYDDKLSKSIQANTDFLRNNSTKPGVHTTPEGLQYQVLHQGDGASPTTADEVEVHYEGTLIDGKKFDSSYDRQETITLALDRVIEGWKIGIPLMKVGSKYRFFVPASLGYGERPSPEIPPHSTLIFDVELISIKSKADEAS